jgi:hypothetical protein
MSDDDGVVIRASELKKRTEKVRGGTSIDLDEDAKEELLNDWFHWFFKYGERYLKDAASKGYSLATLDLPFQLARTFDKKLFATIVKDVKELVPGCGAAVVEEEYEGQTIFKIEVSW